MRLKYIFGALGVAALLSSVAPAAQAQDMMNRHHQMMRREHVMMHHNHMMMRREHMMMHRNHMMMRHEHMMMHHHNM